jgi:uncharacterized membrane protein
MRYDLAAHILAGAMGILSGFVALYAAKGARVHRRSGMVFVYAMLAMALLGAGIAAVRSVAPQSNIPAGLLTAYLVITGLVTVRPIPGWSRRIDISLMLAALAIGLTDFWFGISAFTSANTKLHWVIIPFSIFGTIALLASVGDVRMIRAGGVRGITRIARHLWRMSFALFIATASFFLGQAKVFPKPIRIPGLLALPVLAVLVTMLYWLWRVRVRKTFRFAAEVAPSTTRMRVTPGAQRALSEHPHRGSAPTSEG